MLTPVTSSPQTSASEIDFERRFSGVRRLYGEAGFTRLQHAHVMVIGIGGVGAWTVEALARNAVGRLTLVDLDNIAESNLNRQIHALTDTIGQPKVSAMHARILGIHPGCQVTEIEDFVNADNVTSLLAVRPDVVVDAMDDTAAKIALAAYCRKAGIALVMVGSAGGKLDATRLQCADLARVQGDRMLAKVRNQLRRDHGFPKATGHPSPASSAKSAKFGITAVFSDEPVAKPEAVCDSNSGLTGLHCAGYGSSICVTATAGMIAAQQALQTVLHQVTP